MGNEKKKSLRFSAIIMAASQGGSLELVSNGLWLRADMCSMADVEVHRSGVQFRHVMQLCGAMHASWQMQTGS